MKKTVVSALVVATLSFVIPQPSFAGSSTDAALGLGAFAVFNQLFGGLAVHPVVVAQPPVVYAPPPPVVVYPNGYAYGAPRYYYRVHRKHHHDDDDD